MENYNKELTPIYYNEAAIKVLKIKMKPNKNCFPIHWHERVEFIRIRKGEMYAGFGNKMTKLSEGQMMLFLPKMPHIGYTDNCSVEYDVLMFDVRSFYNDAEICKLYLPAIYEGRTKFNSVICDRETVGQFDNIFQKAEEASLGVIADIYDFLDILLRNNLLELQKEISRDNVIMESIKYMETNFGDEITTKILAEKSGYSSEHFCRKFKKATGLTPMSYLKIYRLEKACKLMQNKNLNIKEIANYCGFDDANYFTRCFKLHFGIAPTKYVWNKNSDV